MKKQPTTDFGPNCIGHVLRIMNQYTLLVDTGSAELNVGDQITVYEYGEPIKNLDGSYRCNYEYPKDTLYVIETTENYSVCEKKETKNIGRELLSPALSPLINMTHTRTERVALNVSSDYEPFKINDRRIGIGDPIKFASLPKKE